MNPVELLSRWSDLCEKQGIKWVLYGETLLCAHGYYRFPAALTEVQVAVEACDMPRVAGEILPEMENVEKVNVYSLTEMPAVLSTLTCNEEAYPVLPDYKKYLAETYGDYEAGLFDPIGVGLTVEEKAELKAHQKKCLEALTFLESLRKEHGIRYYLLAGSVLGAVRHKGFIPWDDDIDVGIRKEDLAQVEALVKEFLPAGFTLEQTAPNHPYPRMFSKICYNGRCCIDLWPLVKRVPDNFTEKVRGLIRKLLSRHPSNDVALPAEWLDTSDSGVFEGFSVPLIGHAHEYLISVYGDNYMSLPAPWLRAKKKL